METQKLLNTKRPTLAYRQSSDLQASNFIGEQGVPEDIGRVSMSLQITGTTSITHEKENSIDATIANNERSPTSVRAPLSKNYRFEKVEPDTSPIQIWEGRVLSVDPQAKTMQVVLSAKIGNITDHTGEIELQWVADQDADLVKPGAVFYLTLYKRLKRGSIENSQELRFRRRPDWTKRQIEKIKEDADRLLKKFKSCPLAE